MTASDTPGASKSVPGSLGFKAGLDEVKTDAAMLRDDVLETGRHVVAAARSGVAAAKERASEAVESARNRVSSAASGLRDQGADQVEDLQLRIMERPLTAVAIALGAGFLVGMLCRRS
jgi:ElaB/YqjD/DUF883 family membrane-anchored ribosome-binding protein